MELYNLVRILRPEVFSSFPEYSQRYCAPKQGPFGMDYSGQSCTAELHCLLSKNMMIRRLKKDVLSELPPKRRQKIEVQCDPKLVKEIQRILEEIP